MTNSNNRRATPWTSTATGNVSTSTSTNANRTSPRVSTPTTKRDRLYAILSDGRRYRMTTLENRLNSPDYAIRGRLSEIRAITGETIVNSNGYVQLIA